jgi:hypothetical protein
VTEFNHIKTDNQQVSFSFHFGNKTNKLKIISLKITQGKIENNWIKLHGDKQYPDQLDPNCLTAYIAYN